MKIIFTHLKPEIWQYKTASALKKKGIKTTSISLKAFDMKLFDSAFDEIVSLNLPDLKPKSIFTAFLRHPLNFLGFFYKLLTIKADAVICQGAPHYLTALFIWLFKGRMKRIYFPYDLNLSKTDAPEKYGYPKIEVWGERYSLKNCDAIILKTELGELKLLPKDINIAKPCFQFPCYAEKKWFCYNKDKISFADKKPSVVYVGGWTTSLLFKSMAKACNLIIKQGNHLHVYCTPEGRTSDIISEITDNGKLKEYLHFHDFVPFDELAKEISKYDFGYCSSGHTKLAKKEAVKFDIGNKFASYLEGGLPIILKEEQEVISKIVKKEGLGIVTNNSLSNLRTLIKKAKYQKIMTNVLKFREEYSVEKNIGVLIDFLEKLRREVYSGIK